MRLVDSGMSGMFSILSPIFCLFFLCIWQLCRDYDHHSPATARQLTCSIAKFKQSSKSNYTPIPINTFRGRHQKLVPCFISPLCANRSSVSLHLGWDIFISDNNGSNKGPARKDSAALRLVTHNSNNESGPIDRNCVYSSLLGVW